VPRAAANLGEGTVNVVYAKYSTQVVTPDGSPHFVQGGQHWPADDPVVRAAQDVFTPDPRYGMSYSVPPPEMAEPPVEQATAAPGEKRTVRRG
jgi:hypothetical protein